MLHAAMASAMPSTGGPAPGAAALAAAWPALASDPTTGVAVVELAGRLVWCNEQTVRMFLGGGVSASECWGRSFLDLGFPVEWINERLAMYERIRATGKAALSRTIWEGVQLLTWHYPLSSRGDDAVDQILAITRPTVIGLDDIPRDDGAYLTIVSEVMRLGPLDALTPRELDVFVLLGQGMTMREAAGVLHRSPKTIERHRESIGRKLAVGRRAGLSEAARRAGLTTADLTRKRV